jgi:cytochrome c-type biogenesis protein CcmH
VREALALRPDHPDGLWLAGLAASQAGRPEETVTYWERLLGLLQDPQERNTVTQYLAEARKQAGGGGAETAPVTAAATPAPAAAAGAAPPVGAASLTVQVDLAPQLRGQVAAGDVVFIFARPPDSRMPLAIVRKTVGELPTSVRLDDSMAMNPSLKLSTLPNVVVAARVSKSGSAVAQKGDLEGATEPLSPSRAEPIRVVIDREL